MKQASLVFDVTAVVVFIQLVTGGSLVLAFLDLDTHMYSGYVVAALALVSVITAFAVKPKYNALRLSSIVLFLLVVVKGALGFSATTSDQIVMVHYTNALIIFAVAIAMTFYAAKWGRIPEAPQAIPKKETTPPVQA